MHAIWNLSRTHCPSSSSLENPVVSGIFMQSFEEQTTQCPSCSSLENPHCVWHHPVSFENHQGWWRMRRVGYIGVCAPGKKPQGVIVKRGCMVLWQGGEWGECCCICVTDHDLLDSVSMYVLQIVIFGDQMILHEPVEKWVTRTHDLWYFSYLKIHTE
jgi:hypothetical protein